MRVDDAVEDAIAAAYTVVGLEDFEASAFHIERALGARGALVFAYPDEHAPRFVAGSFARTMNDGYSEAHYRSDPLHPALRRLSPRYTLHTAQPWLDRAAFEESPTYRDFYRRAGADEVAGLWLTDTRYGVRDMVGMILVGERGFVRSDDLAVRMEPLRVPLQQAARRALRFDRVTRERDVASALLARSGSQIDVVHDGLGRSVWMSPRAERLFRQGRVPARLGELMSGFRAVRGGRVPARLRTTVDLGAGVAASVFLLRDVVDGPWICVTLEADGPAGPSLESLTPAETSVLRCLAGGHANLAIAEELGVSLETVRTHMKRILRKLRVKNRLQASLRARNLGLLDPSE